MNLFQQAKLNMNLTPTQRALLKFITSQEISVIAAALLSALDAVYQFINEPGPIDWQKTLSVGATTLALGIVFGSGHALAKLISATGDQPLALVTDRVVSVAEQKTTGKVSQPVAFAASPTQVEIPAVQTVSQTDITTNAMEDTLPRAAVQSK